MTVICRVEGIIVSQRFRIPIVIVSFILTMALGYAQQPNRSGKRAGDLRAPDTLRVGDSAPDFTLKSKDGKSEVQLSKLRDKPVVLIFGSYT